MEWKWECGLLWRLGTRIRLVLAWLGLGVGIASCGSGEAHLIPPNDFEALLLEVYCINGLVETNDSVHSLFEGGSLDLYSAALEAHGYTLAQFDSTMMAYCRDSKAFKELQARVVARLQHLEDSTMRVHQGREDSVRAADSIASAGNGE